MTKNQASIVTAIVTAVITASSTLGAAYMGVLFLPNKQLEKQVNELREKQQMHELQQVNDLKAKLENQSTALGDFEWQWAGDNWIGSLWFNSLANGDIRTRLDMRSFKVDPKKTDPTTKLFWSDDGIATVSSSGIHLHLPVQLADEFLKGTGLREGKANLEADLKPVEAFAGRVRYWGDQRYTGDIILVRYKSDVRKW